MEEITQNIMKFTMQILLINFISNVSARLDNAKIIKRDSLIIGIHGHPARNNTHKQIGTEYLYSGESPVHQALQSPRPDRAPPSPLNPGSPNSG